MIVDPDIKCFDYGTSVWIGIVLSFMVYIVGMPAISFLAIKRLDREVPENRLKFGKLFALKLPAPCLWGYITCIMFVEQTVYETKLD